MTILAAVATFGSRGQLQRTAVENFIGSVVDTGKQFIAGVIDTGEQFIGSVIDTRDNIFPRCRWYQSEITKKTKIYRWCQRNREKLFTGANISLPTPKNEKKQNSIFSCIVH